MWRALESSPVGAGVVFAVLVFQYLGLRPSVAECAERPRLAFFAGFFLFAPPLVMRQIAPLKRPGFFSLATAARKVFLHAAGKLPVNAAQSGGLAIEGRMILLGYWAALAALFLADDSRAWICFAAPPALAAVLHHFLPPPVAPIAPPSPRDDFAAFAARRRARRCRCALREDIGGGDLSAGLVSRAATIRFDLICRAPTTLCGAAWFERCFLALDKNARFVWRARDGDDVARDFLVCEVAGKARALLSAERAALNFLQTLSATAHSARRFARAAKGRIVVLDTRKTLPKLRRAQKYAVAVGGAQNHRAGLYDEILIKENHIRAAGGIEAALAAARRIAPPSEIEIEVEDLAQLEAALAAGARRVLLDNFSLAQMRRAATANRGRAKLEASGLDAAGGARASVLAQIAAAGIDCVSIGAMTKDIAAADFSLRAR